MQVWWDKTIFNLISPLDGSHFVFRGQNDESNVRIGILGVDLPEKVSSCMILGAMVQKLIFQRQF